MRHPFLGDSLRVLALAALMVVATGRPASGADGAVADTPEVAAALARVHGLADALLKKLDENGEDSENTSYAQAMLHMLSEGSEGGALGLIQDHPRLNRYRRDFVVVRDGYRAVAKAREDAALAAQRAYEERLRTDPAFRAAEDGKQKEAQDNADKGAATAQGEHQREEEAGKFWKGTPITAGDAEHSPLFKIFYEAGQFRRRLSEGAPHERLSQEEVQRLIVDNRKNFVGRRTTVFLAWKSGERRKPNGPEGGRALFDAMKRVSVQEPGKWGQEVVVGRYYALTPADFGDGDSFLLRSDAVVSHPSGSQTLDVVALRWTTQLTFAENENDSVWKAEEMMAAAAKRTRDFLALFAIEATMTFGANGLEMSAAKLVQPVKLFAWPAMTPLDSDVAQPGK